MLPFVANERLLSAGEDIIRNACKEVAPHLNEVYTVPVVEAIKLVAAAGYGEQLLLALTPHRSLLTVVRSVMR